MNTPVRPEMPVEGRTFDNWREFYERSLSEWFRATTGHYASNFEWDAFTAGQFDYQLLRDATP